MLLKCTRYDNLQWLSIQVIVEVAGHGSQISHHAHVTRYHLPTIVIEATDALAYDAVACTRGSRVVVGGDGYSASDTVRLTK